MNVGSLELCKELYEITAWEDTIFVYRETYSIYRSPEFRIALVQQTVRTRPSLTDWDMKETEEFRQYIPAYDLGYMLRKLPPHYIVWRTSKDRYISGRIAEGLVISQFEAKTPEDAVCKLAIELFKKGIL